LSTCAACRADTPAGARFCPECGAPQARECASCGATLPAGARFCPECGTATSAPAAPARAAAAAGGASQLRLISVLFADLVGFTAMSEHRDPDEVRELMSDYYERARAIVERYGGTVAKFIGDAVMAVWGTPVAREDDAERAVRAGLDLTRAVAALGAEVGMPGLQLRVGVLTGSAAVEVGSEAEGMVLGDTVNTASRLQSIAAPGSVLVDDVTRRASEAAIAYAAAGTHQVKGREQAVDVFTALRVVANVGGTGRSAGLEAPFVGRDAALAAVVDAAARSRRDGRAELVLVTGEAGMGKSRLAWEFEKHADGISEEILWHRGRCLSYGTGVAYWALADMVRARAGILEEDAAGVARERLRTAVEAHIPDERERKLVEPRLAHLLGLEQRVAPDRADLFSGWRLFFERIAATHPVVMLFDDLQWADTGLLDFLDYLREWSADFPIFILGFSRTGIDREPTLRLGPLEEEPMRALLAGLVPGLPDELVAQILRRAEGVPLYAVETVRMLLDRGMLAQDGSTYVVTAAVGQLDVPETLHALLASRLDALTADERAVLQDAAVLGQSFTAAGVAAMAGQGFRETEALLDGLVAKQVLRREEDELSAERGQYSFLQLLLRTITYGRLSRRDRKRKHLAAARHLERAFRDQGAELAEVLAAHYLDAAAAEPDAPDVAEIRGLARTTLAEAARRAMSLASGREALRAFDQAIELTEDDAERAELLAGAGRAAWLELDAEAARARLDEAVRLYEGIGAAHEAARTRVVIADLLVQTDRLLEAMTLAEAAVAAMGERTDDRAIALALLARMYSQGAELVRGRVLELTDEALALAEPLQDWSTIADLLATRGAVFGFNARYEEARAVLVHARALAVRHGLQDAELRALNNLAWVELSLDRLDAAADLTAELIAVARARGDRAWEASAIAGSGTHHALLGRWDDAEASFAAVESGLEFATLDATLPLVEVRAARGELQGFPGLDARAEAALGTEDLQLREMARMIRAQIALAQGRAAEACDEMTELATTSAALAAGIAYRTAVEAAVALESPERMRTLRELVTGRPPGLSSPLMHAGADRLGGVLAAAAGDLALARAHFDAAESQLRDIGTPFLIARLLLERAELLGDTDGLAEAREVLAGLRAVPWIERLDRVAAAA